MINIRRIYVYLVSAITLQAVVWATIALLRNLTGGRLSYSTSTIAAQIAMIIVGLPIFLVHWLWAQRSAAADPAERASVERRLYLDAMLMGFIVPMVVSFQLLVELLIENILRASLQTGAWTSDFRYSLISLLITAVMAIYHFRIRQQDDQAVEKGDATVILDQLFIYIVVVAGLLLTATGLAQLIRQIIDIISNTDLSLGRREEIALALSLVITGLPLWVLSWRQAQIRFASADKREQSSIVRKIALYLIVFFSALTAVTTATILFANFLMRLLNVPSTSGGFFNALSIILISVVIWIYYGRVLQSDAAAMESVGQAATVRRIYHYLISAVGLTAVLVGTGGILSVLIRSLDRAAFNTDLREQLAWFTATLIAGLPVWLITWRRIQHQIAKQGPTGLEERAAFVRRFYLYLFIFAAVLTLLGSTVFLVAQLVELALGSRSTIGLITELGQALAYTLIAVAVLIYHGKLLRSDQDVIAEQITEEQKLLNVAVVDCGNGRLGSDLMTYLESELPGITAHPVPLTSAAAELMLGETEEQSAAEILAGADVIVTPWQAANAPRNGEIDPELSQAIDQSAAYKLILPTPQVGFTWIGVEAWQEKEIWREVGDMINNIAKGENPAAARKLSPMAIVIIILASLCTLGTIVPIVIQLLVELLGGF